MKYFTKEFNTQEWLAYAQSYVRADERAVNFDEDYFNILYDKQLKNFIRQDKNNDLYIDPVKELNIIDEYVNEPNISDEEKKIRVINRGIFIVSNRKRLESGFFIRFDKELSKQRFEQSFQAKVKLYNKLPEKIKEKIADMRVFALGSATNEVKRLLRGYCERLRKKVKTTKDNAYNETCDAEEYLNKKLELYYFNDCIIKKLSEDNGDVFMALSNDVYFVFKNAFITEGSKNLVYPYNEYFPNYECSRIIGSELHYVNERFTANFLVSNNDKLGREELWYLTVNCKYIFKY